MAERRGDAARRAAWDVLRAVDAAQAYANLELARVLRERRLSPRDAAFATELVSGTLRMQGAYDAVLAALVDRPLDASVRDALRMGTHQLLSMRVPSHAAVATTVSLVRETAGHRPTRLVNAVLRRVSSHTLEEWMVAVDASLAVRTSHPSWVVEALVEALGRPEELPALLEADNARPAVTLVARPGLATRDELGGGSSPLSPYAAMLTGGDPGAIPAVREGRAGVQDVGSQLVALALAGVPLDATDRWWLDMCAGPGGKAALLGALAAQRQAVVLANERQPHRASLVRRAIRALPAGTVEVVAGDGTRPSWRDRGFDRVLLDAPCSGLGALRRRPEARWRRTSQDVEQLVPLQRALLDRALAAARPGGVVAYATCSPVLAETVGIVAPVLDRGTPDGRPVTLLNAAEVLPQVADAAVPTLPGALQLWPHRHGTDAMFLALLHTP